MSGNPGHTSPLSAPAPDPIRARIPGNMESTPLNDNIASCTRPTLYLAREQAVGDEEPHCHGHDEECADDARRSGHGDIEPAPSCADYEPERESDHLVHELPWRLAPVPCSPLGPPQSARCFASRCRATRSVVT